MNGLKGTSGVKSRAGSAAGSMGLDPVEPLDVVPLAVDEEPPLGAGPVQRLDLVAEGLADQGQQRVEEVARIAADRGLDGAAADRRRRG